MDDLDTMTPKALTSYAGRLVYRADRRTSVVGRLAFVAALTGDIGRARAILREGGFAMKAAA